MKMLVCVNYWKFWMDRFKKSIPQLRLPQCSDLNNLFSSNLPFWMQSNHSGGEGCHNQQPLSAIFSRLAESKVTQILTDTPGTIKNRFEYAVPNKMKVDYAKEVKNNFVLSIVGPSLVHAHNSIQFVLLQSSLMMITLIFFLPGRVSKYLVNGVLPGQASATGEAGHRWAHRRPLLLHHRQLCASSRPRN